MTTSKFFRTYALCMILLGMIGLVLLVMAFTAFPVAGASEIAQVLPPTPIPQAEPGTSVQYQGSGLPDNAFCLSCHQSPFLQTVLPSGEILPVTVDPEAYADSVHGQHGRSGYRCVRCHEGYDGYPHPELTVETQRELSLQYVTTCATCHPAKFNETMDGVHLHALGQGISEAAVCTDCHTAHSVQRLTDQRTGRSLPEARNYITEMCQQCHSNIYDEFVDSVHGRSLLIDGNLDSPTCVDCHGVHEMEGPSTSPFRLFSPQTCATCHADEDMMARNNISTAVFDTYVADFHGTTVTLFQRTAPDQRFNSPVCADCHGVHNIMAVDEPDSPVMKENLLTVCQDCHPNATANFPAAWMSHYQPTFENAPLVATVNLAYGILIPVVVGGMAVFVAFDVRRRSFGRRKDR